MSPATGERVWIDHSLAPLAAGLVKAELETTTADRDAPPDALIVRVRQLAHLLGQLVDDPCDGQEASGAGLEGVHWTRQSGGRA